jgi:hypothetical protein
MFWSQVQIVNDLLATDIDLAFLASVVIQMFLGHFDILGLREPTASFSSDMCLNWNCPLKAA